MRNRESWTPTKFIHRHGRLIGSRDPKAVGIGSRLVTDLIARLYDRHLPEHARGRLLDLGCGAVPLYEAYRDLVDDNVCVDWGASLHDVSFLDHEVDLTGPLPFAPATFDTIILSDVLEHIPVPEQLWGEMARVLSPGGRVMVNVPFFYWLHEDPHDYFRYTEYALRRFVDESGLRLLFLERTGGAADILADVMAKNAATVPVVGRPASAAIQSVAGWFGRTRPGARLRHRSSRRFPLGYFLVAERPADPG